MGLVLRCTQKDSWIDDLLDSSATTAVSPFVRDMCAAAISTSTVFSSNATHTALCLRVRSRSRSHAYGFNLLCHAGLFSAAVIRLYLCSGTSYTMEEHGGELTHTTTEIWRVGPRSHVGFVLVGTTALVLAM